MNTQLPLDVEDASYGKMISLAEQLKAVDTLGYRVRMVR